jgi:hypothetical protein
LRKGGRKGGLKEQEVRMGKTDKEREAKTENIYLFHGWK